MYGNVGATQFLQRPRDPNYTFEPMLSRPPTRSDRTRPGRHSPSFCGSLPATALALAAALVATPALAVPNAPWTEVVVLAGDFATAQLEFEKVRDPVDGANESPTIVLHDPPGKGDTLAYRVHYCPRANRTADGCTAGGSEPIALSSINPA